MDALAASLIAVPAAVFGYSYFGYPAALWLAARGRARAHALRSSAAEGRGSEEDWPTISITIPAYNEAASIRGTIERLLALPYPAHLRQILIVSDASSDGTDDIVREYADRGVELLRLPQRGGKVVAENAAVAHLRGEIVVNMDATIGLTPESLRALIRAFRDPSVGVASGRDVSVGDVAREGNSAESGYVGYEMWVRGLETRLGTIVGASGCFYAIRRELIVRDFPGDLSRDFVSPLAAWERGYRSVSVDDALCFVPRTRSLRSEYRRKVRTMARGLRTLWTRRHLMNPLRHGRFAWMLLSHKLARWLVFPTAPLALVGLVLLHEHWWARALLALSALGVVLGIAGWRWPDDRKVPRLLAVPGFLLASVVASLAAWARAIGGARDAVWEPTRRPAAEPAGEPMVEAAK